MGRHVHRTLRWTSALVALVAAGLVVPAPLPLVTAVAAVGPRPAADAACTISWTGVGADGQWRTTANWDLGRMPGSTDVACIPATAGTVVMNGVGGDTGAPIHVGAVEVAAGAVLLVADSELDADDASMTSVIAELELTGTNAGLGGAGSIEIPAGGHWTWTHGRLYGSGTVTVDAGATATIDSGAVGNLDTVRPLVFNGDLTITAASRLYYMTQVNLSIWRPIRDGDAGGHLTVTGTMTFDTTAASIDIADNTNTYTALDLGGVTRGSIVGSHDVVLNGLRALGGAWTLDPSALPSPNLIVRSGGTQMSADVTLGSSSRFVLHDATVAGAVHAPPGSAALVCPANGLITLTNPAAFDDVPTVDLGDCRGFDEGSGMVGVPRGTTAHVHRMVFLGGSWITGGGTVEVTGDGDPGTVDFAAGAVAAPPNGPRSGGQIRDATVVLDHAATATFDTSMGLQQLDPSAPNGSTSSFVNHGSIEWHDATIGADGIAANGGPQFVNAPDGVIVVRASKATDRGFQAAYQSGFNNGSPFVNQGRLDIQRGDFQVSTPANVASELSGSIEVAAGSVLSWTPGHLTGAVVLDPAVVDGSGAVVTPGARLESNDNFVVSGTLQLGAGTGVHTLYDYDQLGSGVLSDVVDGVDGARTGTITADRSASLDGTLQITTAPTFRPTPLAAPPTITLLTSPVIPAATRTGTFATYTPAPVTGGAWDVRYGPANVQLAAVGSAPGPVAPAHLSVVAGSSNVVVPITVANASTVTAVQVPAGLGFDPASGLLQGSLAVPGTYMVDFAAVNAVGTTTSSMVIDVAPVSTNHAPGVEVSVSPSTAQYAPATVTLDLTGTTDPDGQSDLASWSVAITDGTGGSFVGPSGDATTLFQPISVTLPVPTADTTYDIAVSVTDHAGATTTQHVQVTVLVPQVTAASATATASTSGPSADFAFAFTGRDLGLATTWTFDPGDGSPLQRGTTPVPATITYAYAATGTFIGTLTLLDAGGHLLAASAATVVVTSQNRPPRAILDAEVAHASSRDVVHVHPGFSFEPDAGDSIWSWQLDLVGIADATHPGTVTTVASGLGDPPADVPVTMPNDPRAGIVQLRLTVRDTEGASSSVVEVVRLNDCSTGAPTVLPYDVTAARATSGDGLHAVAQLNVTMDDATGRLPAGAVVGASPVTVHLRDGSRGITGVPLLRTLLEAGGLLGSSSGPVIAPGWSPQSGDAPLGEDVTIENTTTAALPVTFLLSVFDGTSLSRHAVTIVVLPHAPATLDPGIVTSDPATPRAFDVTPVASGLGSGAKEWDIGLNRASSAIGFWHFDSTKTSAVFDVPRSLSDHLSPHYELSYGGDFLNPDPSVPLLLACGSFDLPVLDANRAPVLTVDAPPPSNGATSTVKIVASDPDPAPVGGQTAQIIGVPPGTKEGITRLIVDPGDGTTSTETVEAVDPTLPDQSFTRSIAIQRNVSAHQSETRHVTITVVDAWGASTTTTVDVSFVPAPNQPPTAVLDVSSVSTTGALVPVFHSDDPNAPPTVTFTVPRLDVVLDGSRSSDLDGLVDLARWTLDITGPGGTTSQSGLSQPPSNIRQALSGDPVSGATWTVTLTQFDRTGASSTATVRLRVPGVQSPAVNRPPRAILADAVAHTTSKGKVSADPGDSFDPDQGDRIASWLVELVDLDGAVTKVDSGSGQPSHAVPVSMPADGRAGVARIRLTVTDTKGLSSTTDELVFINDCVAATVRGPLTYDPVGAAAESGPGTGPQAQLTATLTAPTGKLADGVTTGVSPLAVALRDTSADPAGALARHDLVLEGTTLLGTAPAWADIAGSTLPITSSVVLTNPTSHPLAVTFRLTVADALGATSVQHLTITVLPATPATASIVITPKDPARPTAFDALASVTGLPATLPWAFSTTGFAAADVSRSFPAGTALSSQQVVVQRPAGTTAAGTVQFIEGDPAGVGLQACVPVSLPPLSQTEANLAPSLTAAPAAQHATGSSVVVKIAAVDPDPAPLGANAGTYGLHPGDTAGLVGLQVGGTTIDPTTIGAVLGAARFDLDVPVPRPASVPAGGAPQTVTITVSDAWGASTSTTVQIWWDPTSEPLDSDTLNATHAPANLGRNGSATATETISITGTRTSTDLVGLGVDLPTDAAAVRVTTDATGLAAPVDALTGAGNPVAGQWACNRYTSGLGTRLVCLTPGLARPNPRLYVVYRSASAAPSFVITAGATQLAVPAAAMVASVRDTTSLGSLRRSVQDTIPVVGYTANAGPAQTVPDQTVQPGGALVQTRVTLDGSGSITDGRPMTFHWQQTSGPAVTWHSPTEQFVGSTWVVGRTAQFDTPYLHTTTTLRFMLRVDVPAGNGLAASFLTSTLAITVTAAADRPPVITGLTATPDVTTVTPPVGTAVVLAAGATDPDGDPVTFTWSAWRGTGTSGVRVATFAGPTSAQRTLVWPVGVQQLTVMVTANDGLGGTATRTLVLGAPLAPITVSIGGTVAGQPVQPILPPTANPGDAVALTATTNRAPSGGVAWTQVSGPPITGVTFPRRGATLTFAAPAVSTSGQTIVVRATVTDSTGVVSVDQPITLGAAPPPAVALDVWPGNGASPGSTPDPVVVPVGGLFSANATATGTGTLGYAWSTTPAVAPTFPAAPSVVLVAPSVDSFVTVTVTVTDSTGAVASASRLVQVGAGVPTASTDCGNPVFSELVRQASANAAAVGRQSDVTVPIGSPPIGTLDVGPVTFTGDCTTGPSIAFSGATVTLFDGGVQGTGLTGTATRDGACLTGGQLTLPPELGLGPASLATAASPLCISFVPTDWPASNDPPVGDASPDPATPARTAQSTTAPDPETFHLPSFSCTSSSQPIHGSLTWAGAFPGLSVPGPKQTTLSFDCGQAELTSSVSATWGDLALRGLIRRDGSFEASATTKGLRLFGSASNTELTGKLRRSASGAIAWSAAADITSPQLGVTGLSISRLHLALGTSGLTASADGSIQPGSGAPSVAVHLAGTVTAQDDITATLTGSLTAPWTIASGLTVQAGSLAANISRSAGRTKVDVALTVSGDWAVVAPQLTLRSITVKVANHDPGTTCNVVTDGAWFVQVGGTAHLDLGAPTPAIDLTATACIGLDAPGLQLTTTANLNSWKPSPSQDLVFDSVGFGATLRADGGWTFDVTGHARYAGISLAGRARLDLPSGALVFDVGGDLSGLHIPLLAQGHVVITTGTVPGYVPVPLTATDHPAPIDLVAGITAFADIDLGAFHDTLDKILNPPTGPKLIPIPSTIRFTAQLSSSSVRLEGSLQIPGGFVLFSSCKDQATTPCVITDPGTTSLSLTSLFIAIDTSGSFGFGGEGVLRFASSGEGRPPSTLDVKAEASVSATTFTLALSATGDWNTALGIDGLTLSDLVIQGGVVFTSYPPIPTIGVGATVKHLPDPLANLLGIQTDRQEPMTFVLNIAPTAPIVQITLGQVDGHTFLKPVQPISAANADALTVDGASLIIAPFGGTVGPYHYDPGLSLQFAGSLLGVTVNGAASISLLPPHIHASLDVGDVPLGGSVVKATHLLFDATPTSVVVQASGGVDIQGGPRADLLLDVEASLGPPVAASATFSLDVHNWALPNVDTTLERLHVSGQVSASLTSLPSGTFIAVGSIRSGAAHVNVTGTLGLSGFSITQADLAGSISNLTLAGVAFGGPGCGGTGAGAGSGTGVCLSAHYLPGQVPPLAIGFVGTATVAGTAVDVTANFGPTGLHGSGIVRNATLGNPSLTGDWWFGSALAGVTAIDDQGTVHQVQQGDVRLAGSITPAGLFAGTALNGSIGKLGSHAWFAADGSLVVEGHRVASAHLDVSTTGITASGSATLASPFPGGSPFTVTLGGQITYATAGHQLGYDLFGQIAAATAAGQPARNATQPARTALDGATVRFRRSTLLNAPASFQLDGSFSFAGLVGTQLHGDLDTTGAGCFSASLAVAAIHAVGSASIGSTCPTAGFTLDVTANPLSSAGGFAFHGSITAAGGTFSASATDRRQTMIQGTHSYLFPTDVTQVQDWLNLTTGVSASFRWTTAGGFTFTPTFNASGTLQDLVRLADPANLTAPNPSGAVYFANLAISAGVSLSGTRLCVTFNGARVCIGG